MTRVWMRGEGLDRFLQSPHGVDCNYCHGGQSGTNTKEQAHEGMIADPSRGPRFVCRECHAELAEHFQASSLHATLGGIRSAFETRVARKVETDVELSACFSSTCGSCHASCGDCHVSRARVAGGGFVNNHDFQLVPDANYQCAACHSTPIDDEFKGILSGTQSDVHFARGMNCMSCHEGEQMHGESGALHCLDCHILSGNRYHAQHGREFSCQVCHAQDYTNCAQCHSASLPAMNVWQGFKIGRNPLTSRREKIVLLRRVPVTQELYATWDLQTPGFASLPTYKLASPHNIRLWTLRTDTTEGSSCGIRCHNTPDTEAGWFLRAADLENLSPLEQAANYKLILPSTPPPW